MRSKIRHIHEHSETMLSTESSVSSDVLNLGCGRKRKECAINVDITDETKPDVVHDLNQTPWPFPENTFRAVYANDVIEHLDNIVRSMQEIYRVANGGARIYITVPHFSCSNAFTDPTHRHYFGYFSFDCFTENDGLSFYSSARFRIHEQKLIFYPTLISKILWRLANRYPAIYERRWAWMFPAWYLYFELEVVK